MADLSRLPLKENWVSREVFSASNLNDITHTINELGSWSEGLINDSASGSSASTYSAQKIESLVTSAVTVTGVKSGETILSLSGTELQSTISVAIEKKTVGSAQVDHIVLKGINGAEVASVDASAFVKDGMIDSVAWSQESGKTNVLVITWNTDAGKQATEIDFARFIDDYVEGDGISISGSVVSIKIDPTPGNVILSATSTGLKANVELSGYSTTAETAQLESTLTAHTADTVAHVTSAQTSSWDAAVSSAHSHDNKSVLDTITSAKTEQWDSAQPNVIEEVQVNGNALTVSGKSVNVIIPAATVTGVKSGDKVLSLSGTELTTTISIDYVSSAKTIYLKGINDEVISSIDASDFVKDGMLISTGIYKKSSTGWTPSTPTGGTVPTQNGTYIRFEWNTDAGSAHTIDYLNVTTLVDEYEAGDGLQLSGQTFSIKIDPTPGNVTLSATSAGLKASVEIPELVNPTISKTYAELYAMCTGGTLTPGQTYRITDYQCTTTQEGTQSANHQFDIIVTADTINSINESVSISHHSGDAYFENCNLEAWEAKYSIYNDASRFSWADTGLTGKGVIYYLKDDLGNECAYDFKNIMFALQKVTGITWSESFSGNTDFTESAEELYIGKYLGSWFTMNNAGTVEFDTADTKYFYTFSLCTDGETFEVDDSGTVVDGSMRINTSDAANIYRQNVIPELIEPDGDNSQSLNYIVFKPMTTDSDDCCGNIFGKNNKQMTIGYSWSVYNRFGNECYQNSFGNECQNNSFGNNCQYNSFGNSCNRNSFGNNCYSNSFGNGCGSNTFGNSCQNNSFGNNCYRNSFGNECYQNSFGNNCYRNSFGNECNYNSFGNNCYSNSFGNGCYYNSFGNECNHNSFGNSCSYNSFGNEFSKNTLGVDIQYLDFKVNYPGTGVGESGVTYIQILNGYKYSQLTAVPTGIVTGATYCQYVGYTSTGAFMVVNPLENFLS